MKPNYKILYHCGNCDNGDFSHRLLLVRRSGASDSWQAYVYTESTGEIICQSRETGIDQATRNTQRAALYAGISPILSNAQHFSP